ncbi:MAG: hypothetical protein E7158_03245 [Firmicutes bacterium]|nr:hypothetical protein [Bacillota bacterium]
MKEATGELNMTVVIVIAVGVLTAFFYTILWPMIKSNFDHNASCAKAVCKCDSTCEKTGIAKCTYKDKKTGKKTETECPWKG